jgi:hypothetical protein
MTRDICCVIAIGFLYRFLNLLAYSVIPAALVNKCRVGNPAFETYWW